jgi:Universal stress protein family
VNAPPGAIMVGVDGSADSDHAVEWAATAASPQQAALISCTRSSTRHSKCWCSPSCAVEYGTEMFG